MTIQRLLIATGVYPPDIGGPATYARALVDELPTLGVDPTLMNFSPLLRFPAGVRHALFLLRLLTAAGPVDGILALDPVSAGLPALAVARLLRKPLVLRLGGDFAWEQAVERFGVEQDPEVFHASRHGLRLELLKRAERLTAGRAAAVIVPDRSLRRAAERWGVPPGRITEVANIVDLPRLPATRQAARAGLGIDGRWVITMGRLLRLKGFDGLIDAVAALRGEFPDLHLAIAGSGPQLPRLVERARSAGLGDRVRFLGALPRQAALTYTMAADLFVLNSVFEGQANSVLEAMALGTPVIASRAGGTADLIEHGRNGWLVGTNDPAQLTQAMRALLHDPAQAGRLAAAARLGPDRLDRGLMARRTLAVIQSVL